MCTQPSNSMYPFFYCSESDHCFYVAWYGKYNLQLHDYTHSYIQPGSLTQKYEAFRPLYFTWHQTKTIQIDYTFWLDLSTYYHKLKQRLRLNKGIHHKIQVTRHCWHLQS